MLKKKSTSSEDGEVAQPVRGLSHEIMRTIFQSPEPTEKEKPAMVALLYSNAGEVGRESTVSNQPSLGSEP